MTNLGHSCLQDSIAKGQPTSVTWDFLQPQPVQPEPKPKDCGIDDVSQYALFN